MTSERPQRFGPYILLHAAGAGGMGRVHLAISGRAGMAKLCVLKRIHADLRGAEPEARFRREATVALRLSHGAIAQTFSVDEIEGDLCILQEYVEGTSLLALLRRLRTAGESIPVQLAIHIAREVARALGYAHGLEGGGIVHRDVTPDNVMLSYTGEVKLIDFGIAKSAGDANLTQLGMVVGRRSHSAPEVLRGQAADGRADIYSLGVVLWQALTGLVLSEAEPRKVASFGAPSAHNPGVPAALDGVVLKMLSADPADRYQRADEIQEELGHLLDPGFVGDRELVRLLGRVYDVERERGILAAEVARAERELAETEGAPEGQAATAAGSSEPAAAPAPSRALSQTPAGSRRGRIAIGAVLVLAACFLLYRGVKQTPDDTAPSGTAPQATAPQAPTVAPPVPPAAEVARVAPPAAVTPDPQSAQAPPNKQVSARTPVSERHEKPRPRPIASPPPAVPHRRKRRTRRRFSSAPSAASTSATSARPSPSRARRPEPAVVRAPT